MKKLALQIFVAVAALAATASLGYAKDTMTRLADAHSDACDYNYSQCMDGCGGASGCESQCQTNYEGCMAQGQ
jgi:predicted lipoprotein with Yx(FWY)xxD motif